MTRTLLVCNCAQSQVVDMRAIDAGADVTCSRLHSALCTTEAAAAAQAIQSGDAVIACQQEWARFEEIAEELEAPVPLLVDIRDRAGWSDEAATAGPKQAALVAQALLATPATRTVDVESEGRCLILGGEQIAVAAAERLAEPLSVTVLLAAPPEDLPVDRRFEVVIGRLRTATGALGGFRLRLDGLRQMEPGGRGTFTFSEPRDGADTTCDTILDLSGGTPLFPAHEKREGYFRADPGDPNAVAAAVFEAGQTVGTFEKPLYVRLEESLCAHSRAGQSGCSKCLNICPTGAIVPAGDHVAVDPMVCAGCGACSAVCPSAAISFDAPPVASLFRRMETLSEAWRKAGGATARLLVTDRSHGAEMVALLARFGRGLPADVIPFEVEALAGFGHAEMLAALAGGFTSVDILLPPRAENEVPRREFALAEAMGGEGRLNLLEIGDPDALADALYGREVAPASVDPVLALGSRRQVARLAAQALNPAGALLPLPDGAPYGSVTVDTDACTLCLACASLCPSGALGDNPDMPQLRFQEDACLQCGLCVHVCPENAVSLEPRLNLSDAALEQRVLNEEAPYECIECGKPFGVKSTVERIVAQLAGKHSMFAGSDAARLICMCDDCRINAQYHAADNPFAMGERPRVRTTEDYLRDRSKDH